MSADLFPSGPWTGFYNYRPGGERHRMDLHLAFANGSMSGDGNDDVGRFLIKGRYDPGSLECHWNKTYIGGHDVFYPGFPEGQRISRNLGIKKVSRPGCPILAVPARHIT